MNCLHDKLVRTSADEYECWFCKAKMVYTDVESKMAENLDRVKAIAAQLGIELDESLAPQQHIIALFEAMLAKLNAIDMGLLHHMTEHHGPPPVYQIAPDGLEEIAIDKHFKPFAPGVVSPVKQARLDDLFSKMYAGNPPAIDHDLINPTAKKP